MSQANWWVFIKEAILHPRKMGAVLPSSSRLANAMAGALPQTLLQTLPQAGDGYVIELGGGTGTVTQSLLVSGVMPQRLIVFERSFRLVRHLRQQFPNVRVVCGDARYATKYLHDPTLRISAVVSSLPLRVMGRASVEKIIAEVDTLLQDNGVFIQFTYNIFRRCQLLAKPWKLLCSKYVWRNFPPARIDVFSVRKQK